MVATLLSGVVSKWATPTGNKASAGTTESSDNSNSNTTTTTSSQAEAPPSSLWNAAGSTLSSAADSAYSTLAGVASFAVGNNDDDSHYHHHHHHDEHSSLSSLSHDHQQQQHPADIASQQQAWQWHPSGRRFSFGSPWKLSNPYYTGGVRGGRYSQNQTSLSDVRSLLPLVCDQEEQEEQDDDDDDDEMHYPMLADISEYEQEQEQQEEEPSVQTTTGIGISESGESSLQEGKRPSSPIPTSRLFYWRHQRRASCPYTPDPPSLGETPTTSINKRLLYNKRRKHSEVATQLSEGTVRALRDIALDEAVEFHEALRFWSDRWEHPFLSWLEAGPTGKNLRYGLSFFFVCLFVCAFMIVSSCLFVLLSKYLSSSNPLPFSSYTYYHTSIYLSYISLVFQRRIQSSSGGRQSRSNSGRFGKTVCRHW